MIELPLSQINNVRGTVHYKKDVAATLTITLESRGESVFDQSFTVSLPALDRALFFGETDNYFNETDNYFGVQFLEELNQQPFTGADLTAGTDYFRVKFEVDGATPFDIEQIDLFLETSGETA
ncbi:MAG: hypothetical protein IH897_14215 [Planctomycetes bacterium]|nr:hypothetical protein [Planctomycetota bacterium]